MKRVLFTVLIAFCAIVVSNGLAEAYVSGVCSNCHTMHNSQNGSPMAKDATGAWTTSPQGHLTLSSCIGCHNGLGGVVAPNIYGATATSMIAGGTFNAAVAATDSKRHVPIDVLAGGTTAAYKTNGIPGYTGTFGLTVGNFTCAGTTGCHGNHTAGLTTSDAGIRGFHHNKSNTAFRYLTLQSANTPVSGMGSSDWEKTLIANSGASGDHNVYSSSSTGISKLCADCHGGFHGSTQASANVGNPPSNNAWTRHPVDLNISTALIGGITSIAADFINTPVGFASLTGRTTTESAASVTTVITGGTAQVVCISCHRAHGTANDYILRFAYSTQTAGGGGTTGCLNCHVAQR